MPDRTSSAAAALGASLVLTLPPSVRVSLATGATDMRRSVDGLRAMVLRHGLGDPYSGHLFVFRNRRGDRLKILVWDRSGFWVLYKRLEKGTFAWPETSESGAVSVSAGDLVLLLSGVDLSRTHRRNWYERAA
jgi:transposase